MGPAPWDLVIELCVSRGADGQSTSETTHCHEVNSDCSLFFEFSLTRCSSIGDGRSAGTPSGEMGVKATLHSHYTVPDYPNLLVSDEVQN